MSWLFRKSRLDDVCVRLVKLEGIVARLARKGISPEEEMNRMVKTFDYRDKRLFIDQCKASGIAPESMVLYLTDQLKSSSLGDYNRETIKELHGLLTLQLKAEKVKSIAEDYQFRGQKFIQLKARCDELEVTVDDIVQFFDASKQGLNRHEVVRFSQLTNALQNKQNCPAFLRSRSLV
jgi:hypothetical protein